MAAKKIKRKTVSIKINPKIWSKVKYACVKLECSYSDYVEKSILKNLQTPKHK